MDNFEFIDEHIQHLIISYLEGKASEDEILTLQQWLAQSKENFSLFTDYRKYWLIAGGEQRYETNLAWQKIDRQIDSCALRAKYTLWKKMAGYAAILFILFGSGYYWIHQHSITNEIVATNGEIEPGEKKAILVLGSKQVIELNNCSSDSLFKGNSTIKKEGNTLVYEEHEANAKEEYNRLITPRGGEYSIILADGTKVWLNSESELRYPVVFGGVERKVYLKGEAYFSVTKQAGKPFIVCSDEARITVLGTEFNVRNYGDEAISATLVKGAVLVSQSKNQCKLVPGQQALIGKNGIEVQEVDPILYTAWKDGFFIYRDKTLEDILKELARWYDFTYFYQNTDLEKLTLTAKLRKFDRVEQIFEILKETGRFDFVTKGKTVTVVAK